MPRSGVGQVARTVLAVGSAAAGLLAADPIARMQVAADHVDSPGFPAVDALIRARRAARAGRMAESAAIPEAALREAPDDRRLLFALAITLKQPADAAPTDAGRLAPLGRAVATFRRIKDPTIR